MFTAAVEAAADCDVFLAVGSSLLVQPVAYLPLLAVHSDARLVVVNGERTPCDTAAAAVLTGPIGDVLPRLVSLV